MKQVVDFMISNAYFSVPMAVLNFIMALYLIQRICICLNKHLYDARLERGGKIQVFRKYLDVVRRSIKEYEQKGKKKDIYIRIKEKMKRSGYSGEYAAVNYLLLKYVLPFIVLMASLALNYPGIYESIAISALIAATVELVVKSRRKKHNLIFEKNIYKIYKYLHNQVSSGVKVTDAIKTVYEVAEDRWLKDILVRLAASYELTLDIDLSLEEFKSNFDAEEAETLCVALKQGIMTGDNQELLSRQEDIMFKKYFNYIQAETDNCKMRCALAAALFTVITIVMIAVPLFNEVTEAVGKIFVN